LDIGSIQLPVLRTDFVKYRFYTIKPVILILNGSVNFASDYASAAAVFSSSS
jgi:hypothetical protein